jgi:biotin transport system substrate-specific component
LQSKRSVITVRGIVFSALFAALMIVSSFANIHLGFTPIPITLENMAAMLAGAFLGPLYGFLSIFIVIFLLALGVPVMPGAVGLARILGPTGGFLWMFPISALLIGLFIRRIQGSGWKVYVKVFLVIWLCSLTVYLAGVPWLMYKANIPLSKGIELGFTPFILGDTLKAIVATLIVVPVRRIFPMSKLIGGEDAEVVQLPDDQG